MRKILIALTCLFLGTPVMAVSLINDTETEAVLNQLVVPLAKAADIEPERLKIHIVNDDDFNAFVMGGEDVYIYTGLLKKIKNPSALQAVVAHEMGHTIGGHMAQLSERMNAEMKRTMLIQALGVGLMVAGGNPSLGAGVMAGATGVAQQSVLAFSRDEERIADNLGVELMVRAGLDPNGFTDVFKQMKEITGAAESKINPNRVNHPLTDERLKNIQEQIATKHKNYKPQNINTKQQKKDYELVRAKLVGYLDSPTRVRELYPDSDKSDSAIYARAIANMRGGNLDAAKVGIQTLISRQPNNPYFYELLGDVEYQYGHYDDSVDAYNHALKLNSHAPQIQTALGLVLVARDKPGDKDQAIDLCRRALLQVPAPLTFWVMARAFDADDGRADWALAEYYNMIGDEKNVKKYAKRAQKRLSKKDPEYIKAGDLLK